MRLAGVRSMPAQRDTKTPDVPWCTGCRTIGLFWQLQGHRAVRSAALCVVAVTVSCAEAREGERAPDDVKFGASPVDAGATNDAVGQAGAGAMPASIGPNEGWMMPKCGESGLVEPIDVSLLGTRADYVALRMTAGDGMNLVIHQGGTPCESASDVGACMKRLNEIGRSRLPAGCSDANCLSSSYLVTTRGDLVEVWSGESELRRLLAPIDTIEEALLLLQAQYAIDPCGLRQVGYRERPNGFELRVKQSGITCRSTSEVYSLKTVTYDGTIVDGGLNGANCVSPARRP